MRFVTVKKWLCLLATGTCFLQAGGCPDAGQIRDKAASSVGSFINGVASMYVNAAVDSALGDPDGR